MTRNIETLFDVLEGIPIAATMDATELDTMCRKQQVLTMERIATWLRSQTQISAAQGKSDECRRLAGLAEELEYLSTLPVTYPSAKELQEWVS